MKEVRSVVFRSIMPIKEALRGVWSLAILRSNWRLLDDHNQTRRQRSLRMSLFRNGISRSCKEGNYHAASCIVQSHHRYKRKPKIQKWIYIYISTTRLTSIKNGVWICLAQMSQSPRSTLIPTKWHSFDCYTQLPIGKRIFVPHPNLSGIFITGKLITLPDRWRSIIFTAIVLSMFTFCGSCHVSTILRLRLYFIAAISSAYPFDLLSTSQSMILHVY